MLIKWLVVVPIVVLALLIIMRDAVAYMRCKYYESQGFVFRFRPVLGFITLFLPSSDKRDEGDVLNPLRRALAACKDKHGLVINDWFKMKAYIWITDYKLVKEFFVKETTCTQRFKRFNERIPMDFFYSNSQRSLDQKSAFAEMFRIEHLNEISKHIIRTWRANLSQELTNKNISQVPNLVDFLVLVRPSMIEIANKVLFGGEHPVPIVEETGEQIPKAVLAFYGKLNTDKGEFSLSNILSFGLLSRFDLTMVFIQATKEAKEIKKAIISCFEARLKLDDSQLGNNLMDIMVKANKQAGETKFSDDEIVAFMSVFLFAGIDTTSKTLTAAIYRLGLYPEIAEKIREEVINLSLDKQSVTMDELDKAEVLARYYREVLRVNGSGAFLFERLVTSDFMLGNICFKKGDLINIPITYFHSEFGGKDGEVLFEPKMVIGDQGFKSPGQAYLPFSIGKRSCPGQFLVEMIIKIFIVQIVKHLKLETDESRHKAYMKMTDGYGMDKCTVKCTLIEPFK